jgi:hypothetical protein
MLLGWREPTFVDEGDCYHLLVVQMFPDKFNVLAYRSLVPNLFQCP